MAKTINLGKVGLTFEGDYDSSKNYASRTCVFYDHVSWASKKDVPAGIAPGSNDEYWQKVSERGAQGIQGERGPQGNSAFDGTGIELVNNLTQGGEASALSAEQGKVLDGKLTELSKKTSPFFKTIDVLNEAEVLENSYINFETGHKTTAGSGTQAVLYKIDLANYPDAAAVQVTCGFRDSVIAAIAFFSTYETGPSSYMKNDSVISHSTSGELFEVTIPVGAKVIAVSNIKSLVSTPTIRLINHDIQQIKKQVKSNSNAYAEIEIAAEDVESGKYVIFSSGEILKTTASIKLYKLSASVLNQFDFISVKGGSLNSVPATIAFYTGEPSTATYIKDASVQANEGVAEYKARVPYSAKYALISNAYGVLEEPTLLGYVTSKKREEILIGERTSNVVSSPINQRIDISGYPIGTIFRVSFSMLSYQASIYLLGSSGKSVTYARVQPEQRELYLIKQSDCVSLQFYMSAKEGNDAVFQVFETKSSALPDYIQSNYIYRANKEIRLGRAKQGYWETPDILRDDNSWVCYPIQYSRGYKLRISCVDFDTYYVEIKLWNINLNGYDSTQITQETEFDLMGVTAWHVQYRRHDRAAISPSLETDVISISLTAGEVWERPVIYSDIEKDDKVSFANPFSNAPYYAHFAANDFIRDGNGNNAIASESIEDVEMAARLGFKFIEANIHKNASGDFVCIHGNPSSSGSTFGPEVISLDGSNVRDMKISQVTTAYMDENIRYASYYQKYQTKVPTLDRFLKACKENNIGIFAGTSDKEAIDMCIKYLGQDNVILYNPPQDVRDYFSGYVFTWNNTADVSWEKLVIVADKYGAPYMCGIGPSLRDALIENDTFDKLIGVMHKRGYLVGMAAVYQKEDEMRDAFVRGIDFAAAGHEVNPFQSNLKCIDLDGNISQFATNGVFENGVLELQQGQTLVCGDGDILPLGKGLFTARFTGRISVDFGSQSVREVVSSGEDNIVVSDYFFRKSPKLTITALEQTVITSLVYKISEC